MSEPTSETLRPIDAQRCEHCGDLSDDLDRFVVLHADDHHIDLSLWSYRMEKPGTVLCLLGCSALYLTRALDDMQSRQTRQRAEIELKEAPVDAIAATQP